MDMRRHVADGPLPSVMLEGYAVVYHAASGATHLLASPAPEILAAIAPARGAATVDAIVARLQAEYDIEAGGDGAGAAAVAARLTELAEAGLVRTV